ncbi:MAG TPA: cytochrome P450 [Chthoniobacteraceae bacterium]|jgi:CRP-like cAMP-binding protein/cytochrome P450|nr:cytochrome P450 [Chthoniobacteraceae bacterium]
MSTTADRPEAAPADAEAPLAPLAKGLPILGSTFGFLRDTTALLLRSYRELGPVYRLRALWLKYTVIAGFEARDFIRQGLDDQYLSREEVFRDVGVQLGAADFVLGQSGEKHVRFRKLLSVAYSREVGSRWVPEFIGAVRERARAWTPGTIVGVMDEVSSMAFEQYCRAMCGRSLRAHYRDCLRVTDYNMNVGGRVWPFFMYKMPWYRASRLRVLDLLWGMVRERKAAGRRPGERGTILGTLMAIRDGKGEPLTDDEVVCYSMYGFAGSCSYMSRVIGFLLYELLQRPELLAQVTAEVDAAFAEGIENAADVRRLTLLQAVYHETLRFHPVSQGMPHVAARDFVYLGKRVQKGDVTVLSQVPMSFSKCPFHQPEKFEPERCLAPRSEHRQENAFHPFGIGHRTCTATGLVELMTLTMVATLLHELRFTASPADYQLRLKVKPLPAPDDAFKLRIEAHRTDADRATAPRAADEEEVLATFPGHDEPAVAEALQRAAQRTFASGEVIIREGEAAEAFYIIVGGSAEVTRAVNGAPQTLAQLGEGQFFGEIGLLQNIPRTATVTAGPEGVEVLELGRADFLDLVTQSDLVSQDMARLLQKRMALQRLVEALPRLGAADAERLLPEFRPRTFPAGAVIVREGDVAEHFYILVDGEALVTRSSQGVAVLKPGEYFGEAGLLSGAPRNATVTVAPSGPATVLVAEKSVFQRMIQTTGGERGNLAQAMLHRLGER